MFHADSYNNIQRYAQRYSDTLKQKGGITNPQFEKDVFAVLMEKWNVTRLISHPDCYRLAAIIGIDDEEKMTISLLAVGKDGRVLPQHKGPISSSKTGDVQILSEEELPGEEVWPLRVELGMIGELLP